MNFFERILTGRLFFKKKEEQKPTEVSSVLPISTAPDRIIRFTFMEKSYILETFELNFNQELNAKGLPGSLTRGGIMTLTMSETPDHYINEWMLREGLQRDGLIEIFPNKQKIDEGAELVIEFKNAYCIRYNKKIETLGVGLLTTLVISPHYIKIGNEEFINRWKKQEDLSFYVRSN